MLIHVKNSSSLCFLKHVCLNTRCCPAVTFTKRPTRSSQEEASNLPGPQPSHTPTAFGCCGFCNTLFQPWHLQKVPCCRDEPGGPKVAPCTLRWPPHRLLYPVTSPRAANQWLIQSRGGLNIPIPLICGSIFAAPQLGARSSVCARAMVP